MNKIDVKVAGLDHGGIHNQVIWWGKSSICVQCARDTNSG